MRSIVWGIALIFLTHLSFAQIKNPPLSPSTKIVQKVGLTEVILEYSRPSKRGRKVVGEIIKNDVMWRLGANSATSIEFKNEAIIAGNKMKGKYAITAIPHEKSLEFRFYKYDGGRWSNYKDKTEFIKVETSLEKPLENKETLELFFTDLTVKSMNLVFAWGDLKTSISISFDTESWVKKSIDQTLKGPSDGDYYNAGSALAVLGSDLEKALEYVRKVTTKKEGVRYWQLRKEVEILDALGRGKKEGIPVAERGKKLAEEADNKDYVLFFENKLKAWK